jgi:hypothetical protein
MTETFTETAFAIATHLQKHYMSPQGVHAETLIAAAAAVCGEWGLWATGVPIPADAWVFIPEVDALLLEGPEAARRLVEKAVAESGGSISRLPSNKALAASVAAAIGSTFPPLSVGESHYPQEWSPVAAPRFRQPVKDICAAGGYRDPKSVLHCCAFALGIVISATSGVLDPVVAGTLALEVMVGVSRMSPAATQRSLDGGARR